MWSAGVFFGVCSVIFTQRQFDLQRRGADQPGELRLGPDLVRHQVEQADAQRADVLPAARRPRVITMTPSRFERLAGGEIVRDLIGISAQDSQEHGRRVGGI